MVVRFAGFVARSLFNLALAAFLIGAALVYLSFRLLRWAVGGLPPTPRKDAMFALLLAAAVLARTLGADTLLKGAPDDDNA